MILMVLCEPFFYTLAWPNGFPWCPFNVPLWCCGVAFSVVGWNIVLSTNDTVICTCVLVDSLLTMLWANQLWFSRKFCMEQYYIAWCGTLFVCVVSFTAVKLQKRTRKAGCFWVLAFCCELYFSGCFVLHKQWLFCPGCHSEACERLFSCASAFKFLCYHYLMFILREWTALVA